MADCRLQIEGRVLLTVVGAFLMCASAFAQVGIIRDGRAAPRTGTASIRGRVTSVDTGQPLRRAEVQLGAAPGVATNPGDSPIVVATDEQGYYQINKLPAGRFTLTASKTGYMTLQHGQRRPLEGSRPIELTGGQALENVNFALPRGAVIVARITDEFGEPAAGVRVTAQQYRFVSGVRRLVNAGNASSFVAGATDDFGEMRIAGLAPGEYIVSAATAFASVAVRMVAAGPGQRYGTTYYPGTSSVDDARRVTVAVGQEATVTFPLVPVRLARLSGTLRDSTGAVPQPQQLRMSLTFLIGYGNSSGVAVNLRPDGSFSAVDLAPGEYALTVSPGTAQPGGPKEYAQTQIFVKGEDITGLSVTTGKGATMRGRFVFDTGAPSADARPGSIQFRIAFPQSPGTQDRPSWNADWTFEFPGLLGSGAIIRSGAFVTPGQTFTPSTWYIKAVMLEGKDVFDTPFNFESGRDINDLQVILTQKQTELNGHAMDAEGRPVPDYVTVVFPENRALWTPQTRFISTGRPDQTGTFKVVGLPAGSYLATAVDYLETGAEGDPELLAKLVDGATRVSMGEGETKSLSLRVVSY